MEVMKVKIIDLYYWGIIRNFFFINGNFVCSFFLCYKICFFGDIKSKCSNNNYNVFDINFLSVFLYII